MSRFKPELLTANQYAVLWFAAAATMGVSAVGNLLGWWGTGHFTWWLALAALVSLSAAQTYEYIQERRASA